MRTLKRFLTFALLLSAPLVLAACAPGLGKTLAVSFEDKPEVTPLMQSVAGNPPKVQVLKFVDARPVEAVAQIDGRIVKPSNDLGLVVQRTLENALKKNGLTLSVFDSAIFRGEIKEWHVLVTPGFPSTTLKADAGLIIELLDFDGKRIHRAQYSGHFEEENPFIGEGDVSGALAGSLDYAIKEALSDPVLVNKISTLNGMVTRQEGFERDDDLY